MSRTDSPGAAFPSRRWAPAISDRTKGVLESRTFGLLPQSFPNKKIDFVVNRGAVATGMEKDGPEIDDIEAMMRMFQPRIFRFALASLRDRDAAETVTQDCFAEPITLGTDFGATVAFRRGSCKSQSIWFETLVGTADFNSGSERKRRAWNWIPRATGFRIRTFRRKNGRRRNKSSNLACSRKSVGETANSISAAFHGGDGFE